MENGFSAVQFIPFSPGSYLFPGNMPCGPMEMVIHIILPGPKITIIITNQKK